MQIQANVKVDSVVKSEGIGYRVEFVSEQAPLWGVGAVVFEEHDRIKQGDRFMLTLDKLPVDPRAEATYAVEAHGAEMRSLVADDVAFMAAGLERYGRAFTDAIAGLRRVDRK